MHLCLYFLEEVALATDLDADKKDDKPKVSLMSIHQSKGLEYPYVYIVGLRGESLSLCNEYEY